MNSKDFLTKLKKYVDDGNLSIDVYDEIEKIELNKISIKNVEEVKFDGFFNRKNAMRYSLGVAAGIGSILVILGFGLLTSLIQDITSDYENNVEGMSLYWFVFGLLSILSIIMSKIKLEGRAEVFLGEALSIIFGISSMISITSFYNEFVYESNLDNLGLINIFNWFPILILVVLSIGFARKNDAWVSYSLGWILWFVPISYAYNNESDVGIFISLVIIMIVLVSEILREWFDNQRREGSWIQFLGHGLLLGIISWNVIFSFSEAFYILGEVNDGDLYEYHIDNPLMGMLFIIGWMIFTELFPKKFGDMKYKNSTKSKAWILIPGCLIFYTFIQLYTGFMIAETIGFTVINVGEFDVDVGFIFGFLIYITMGMQMFSWKPEDVVLKPSLTYPGTFMGSVFLIMSFFTLISSIVDFLEDLAGYLFLPVGLLVLILGTMKLINSSKENIPPESIIISSMDDE
tara:strand:+ start:53 stop:1432 length:1380 start_codon:yes stop_codon:yes gene_type:complete